MDRPTSKPPLPPREDAPPSAGGAKSKFGGITTTMGIVMILVAVVVSYFAVSLLTVKPATYNAAIAGLQKSINDVSTAEGKDASAIAQLQTDVKNANNSATSANAAAQKASNDAGTANTTASGFASQIASLQSTINDDATKVKALQTVTSGLPVDEGTITDLNNTITKLTAQLATDETNLANAQAAIKVLQTVTTTTPTTTPTTTTPTTTPVASLVTATVLGNAFSGSKILAFTDIPLSTTVNQTFSFTITNATGTTINNVQLAIGLELLDSAGNIISAGLPSDSAVTLSSGSLATIWTQQSTGYKYLLGFTNTSTTGVFGGIGVISQGIGTTTYSITVTISSGAVNTIPAFNIFPIVKVVSFN